MTPRHLDLAPLRLLRAASRAGQEPSLRHAPLPASRFPASLATPPFSGIYSQVNAPGRLSDTIINPALDTPGVAPTTLSPIHIHDRRARFFRFGGISLTVRADLPQLAVTELTVEPGVVAPPHRHPHVDEVFIGLEGSLQVTLEDHTVTLGPGEIATVPGGQTHGFATSPDTAARAAVVYAPGGFLGYFRDAASANDPEQFQQVLARWDVRPA